MSAFALFGFLSFISHRWSISVVFALLAMCIGLSRVYLNHHFIEDVGFGAIIGVFLGWLVYVIDLYSRKESNHWSESALLKRKITKL
jgi:membrane-associated phospholipid phosphatase